MRHTGRLTALLLAAFLCFSICSCSTADARHWSKYVLKVFEDNSDTLSSLF